MNLNRLIDEDCLDVHFMENLFPYLRFNLFNDSILLNGEESFFALVQKEKAYVPEGTSINIRPENIKFLLVIVVLYKRGLVGADVVNLNILWKGSFDGVIYSLKGMFVTDYSAGSIRRPYGDAFISDFYAVSRINVNDLYKEWISESKS